VIGRRRDAVIARRRSFRERQRARLVAVGMRLSGVVCEQQSTLGVTKQCVNRIRTPVRVEVARLCALNASTPK